MGLATLAGAWLFLWWNLSWFHCFHVLAEEHPTSPLLSVLFTMTPPADRNSNPYQYSFPTGTSPVWAIVVFVF